jgi:tetratricopeptide (TPR) repeat protein
MLWRASLAGARRTMTRAIADTVAEVDALVERLRSAPRGEWWKIVRQPEYQRANVARRLLSLAVDAKLRDVQISLDLAKVATAIAETVADARGAADVRFEAWKFSSVVLREVGRYTEAEDALSRGDEAARSASDPDLARASMLLCRALFYAEPDIWRPQEAAVLLDRAEIVFVERDAARMQMLHTVRAFLLFRSGAMKEAREAFQCLLAATSPDDREEYLNALSNLLWVRVELHEVDSDIDASLELLVEENRRLARVVQVARAEWMTGRVKLRRGEYAAAVELLSRARLAIGDSDASIRVGIDVIEALLLAGRHDDAFGLARDLTSAALTLDRREPTRRHRLTSQVFAYLQEAAQQQALTADLVTDVARYLDRMMRQRPLDFIPPMPLIAM